MVFWCACYWIHHLSITLTSSKRSYRNCITQGGLGVDSDSSKLLLLTTRCLLSILGGHAVTPIQIEIFQQLSST